MTSPFNFVFISDCSTETHDYDNLPKPGHYRQNSNDKLISKFKSSPNIRSEETPTVPETLKSGPGPEVNNHRRAGSLPRSARRTRNLTGNNSGINPYRTDPGPFSYYQNLSKSSVFPVEADSKHQRAGSVPRSRTRMIAESVSSADYTSRPQSQPPHQNREFLSQQPPQQQDRQYDITVRPRVTHNIFVENLMSDFQSFQPSYSYRNNSSFNDIDSSSVGSFSSRDSTRQTGSPKSAPYWSNSSRNFF